jgi:hypothetical protein
MMIKLSKLKILNEECKVKNLSLLVKNNLNSAYIKNKLKKR